MSTHVLIAEDEDKIARLLCDYFTAEGMRCSRLERGDEVEAFVTRQQPDLLLLDLMLPGKSGLDICRDLRRDSEIPILMITARVDEIDRLLGLELGADDYICKPFSPREVVARARAVLRRLRPTQSSRSLALGPLRLDINARLAWVHDAELPLTPLEFDLLGLFLAHPNEVLSRSRLLRHATGNDYTGYERNIDSHVKNLRKKLRERLQDQDPFRTVYGVGYALQRDILS